MPKVILDTDIGTNPDDAIAYALAIHSPEIDLLGVTTVYGDTHIRGRVAQCIAELCNRETIPIFQGIERPLLRQIKVYWSGLEDRFANPSSMMLQFMDDKKRDYAYLCDPLAIAVLLDPSLIETKRMDVEVWYGPQTNCGITQGEIREDGKVKVALEVDKERFFALIYNRIFSN